MHTQPLAFASSLSSARGVTPSSWLLASRHRVAVFKGDVKPKPVTFTPAKCTRDIMRAEFEKYVTVEADPVSLASTSRTWAQVEGAVHGANPTSTRGGPSQTCCWWIMADDGSRIGLVVYHLKTHLVPQAHIVHISVKDVPLTEMVVTSLRVHIFERYPEVSSIRATLCYTETPTAEDDPKYAIDEKIEGA